MGMIRTIAAAAVAVGLLAGSAAQAAVDGPALYKENCQKCHAETGRADTWRGYVFFARNFTNAKWQAARSDEQILDRINRGTPVMPRFEKILTLEQRQALVQVVRGFGKPPAAAPKK